MECATAKWCILLKLERNTYSTRLKPPRLFLVQLRGDVSMHRTTLRRKGFKLSSCQSINRGHQRRAMTRTGSQNIHTNPTTTNGTRPPSLLITRSDIFFELKSSITPQKILGYIPHGFWNVIFHSCNPPALLLSNKWTHHTHAPDEAKNHTSSNPNT